jgi:hypothetical protein
LRCHSGRRMGSTNEAQGAARCCLLYVLRLKIRITIRLSVCNMRALCAHVGKPMWREPLPAEPIAWGLAINRSGGVLITLQNGRVLCLGPAVK